MPNLVFLGTAASVPTIERSLPSVAVKGKELYLFDCGEGTQRQMMKYRVGFGSVKGIFISHLHLDHFLGAFGLIETIRLSSVFANKLSIFAPPKFKEIMLNKWGFLDVNEIKPGVLLKDCEAEISAFRVKHVYNCFGFVYKEYDKLKFYKEKAHKLGLKGIMFREIQEKGQININGKKIKLDEIVWKKPGKKIVYAGDCIPSENTVKAAKNADVLIHDGTFTDEFEQEALERGHSTAKQAAEIAKEAEVKQLILTHISGRYKDTNQLLKEARKVFPNTIVAEDGLKIEVKS